MAECYRSQKCFWNTTSSGCEFLSNYPCVNRSTEALCWRGTGCVWAPYNTTYSSCVPQISVSAHQSVCDAVTIDPSFDNNLLGLIKACHATGVCEYRPTSKRCDPLRRSTCTATSNSIVCEQMGGCVFVTGSSKCYPNSEVDTAACYTLNGDQDACELLADSGCRYNEDTGICLLSAAEKVIPGMIHYCNLDLDSITLTAYSSYIPTNTTAAQRLLDLCLTKGDASDTTFKYRCEPNYMERRNNSPRLCEPHRLTGCATHTESTCGKASFCYYDPDSGLCKPRRNGTDGVNMYFTPQILQVQGQQLTSTKSLTHICTKIVAPLTIPRKFAWSYVGNPTPNTTLWGWMVTGDTNLYSDLHAQHRCGFWLNPSAPTQSIPNPINSSYYNNDHADENTIQAAIVAYEAGGSIEDLNEVLTDSLLQNTYMVTGTATYFEEGNVLYDICFPLSYLRANCTNHYKEQFHTNAAFHQQGMFNLSRLRLSDSGSSTVEVAHHSFTIGSNLDNLGFMMNFFQPLTTRNTTTGINNSTYLNEMDAASGASNMYVRTLRHNLTATDADGGDCPAGTKSWRITIEVSTSFSLGRKAITALSLRSPGDAVRIVPNTDDAAVMGCDHSTFAVRDLMFEACSFGSQRCFSQFTLVSACRTVTNASNGEVMFGDCSRKNDTYFPLQLNLGFATCSYPRLLEGQTSSMWYKRMSSESDAFALNCSVASNDLVRINVEFGGRVPNKWVGRNVVEDLEVLVRYDNEVPQTLTAAHNTDLPDRLVPFMDVNVEHAMPPNHVVRIVAQSAFQDKMDIQDVNIHSLVWSVNRKSFDANPDGDSETNDASFGSLTTPASLPYDLFNTANRNLFNNITAAKEQSYLAAGAASASSVVAGPLLTAVRLYAELLNNRPSLFSVSKSPVLSTGLGATEAAQYSNYEPGVITDEFGSPSFFHDEGFMGFVGDPTSDNFTGTFDVDQAWWQTFSAEVASSIPDINCAIALWKQAKGAITDKADHDTTRPYTAIEPEIASAIFDQLFFLLPRCMSVSINSTTGISIHEDLTKDSNIARDFLVRRSLCTTTTEKKHIALDEIALNATIWAELQNYVAYFYMDNITFTQSVFDVPFVLRRSAPNPRIVTTSDTSLVFDSMEVVHKTQRISMFLRDSAFDVDDDSNNIETRVQGGYGDLFFLINGVFVFNITTVVPDNPYTVQSSDHQTRERNIIIGVVSGVVGLIVLWGLYRVFRPGTKYSSVRVDDNML